MKKKEPEPTLDQMTLRDLMAMFALHGLMPKFDFGEYKTDPWRVAMWAYDAADQMLRVRSGDTAYPQAEERSKQ